MPRDIPLGNGRLLVCFDSVSRIRDLYYPHVGQENHVTGNTMRLGIWVDGIFSWIEPGSAWKSEQIYETNTLVARTVLYNEELGLIVTFKDCVDFHADLFIREVNVKNLLAVPRILRIYFHQDFDISGNSVGDTAAYDPKSLGIVHYKAKRYFLVNCMASDGRGPHEYATGLKDPNKEEGTYYDAEDGNLSGNPIAQGSVDSVIALHLGLEAGGESAGHYWIAAGQTWDDVLQIDALVKYKTPQKLTKRTRDYWRLWILKETPPLELLPKNVRQLYNRSLLILRTQIDHNGGIVAANDSDVIQFNKDTYSYVWPRDGALVANALDLAGYPVPAQNFFNFISRLITRDGYLMHKYNPDGSLASSWHPWVHNGKEQLPIQEDETALAIWSLWNHFVIYRDIEFIKPLYRPFVKRAAQFLCEYREGETGLPLPSYDLWEENRGVHAFTIGAIFGGLTAAALFCSIFGEKERAEYYRTVAAEIRDASSRHLWQEDEDAFCKSLEMEGSKILKIDSTCDSSAWGLFAFGLYSANDPRIRNTMKNIKGKLWVRTPVGGMARYEDDGYYRVSDEVPGNPWFICTLWYGDYLIEIAENEEQLEEAIEILEWTARHALSSGVLAEQVHPYTGVPLSVSPLTWSHSTFVATCQRLMNKVQKFRTGEEHRLPKMLSKRDADWVARLFSQECDNIHKICTIR